MQAHRPARFLLAALLLAACDPADDVKVQPLPSLGTRSAEARAGLPTIAGDWRFAGWEVAGDDSAALRAPLPRLGTLLLRSQKRDSIGGSYLLDGGRAPLAGEIRRDGTVSLITYLAPGDGRYLAGTLERDTIWMELSSLVDPGGWPDGARVAFVRGPAAVAPFQRMAGALPPPVDTATAPLASVPPDSTPATGFAPAATAPAAGAGLQSAQPPPQTPRPQAPRPQTPVVSPPVQARPTVGRPEEQPEPRPQPDTAEEAPSRETPRLLGVPVERDSNSTNRP